MDDRFALDIFILFIGATIAAVFMYVFRYNYSAQLITAFFGCIYYIVWGIMHHAAKERLSAFIVLEYILVGGLIFFLLASVLSI